MKRFLLEYLPAWLLLMVFGFIVIHAPLTVWVGVNAPQFALTIKAWKELMTLLALVLIAVALYKKQLVREFVKTPVILVALAYCALHILMIGIYPQGVPATIAGLMIDLRYVAYFIAVFGFLRLYPQYKPQLIRVGLVGAAIVVGFTVVELFLPKDTLRMLGYGGNTIQPYMTVDKNPDFIRYNSTLRGPNPLGAYALIVIAGVVAFGVKYWAALKQKRAKVGFIALSAAALVALWVSYSRSALIGAVIAVGAVLFVLFGKKLTRWWWYGIGIGAVIVAGLLFAVKDTTFMQNVILHNNPTTGASIDSNAAHAESLVQGLQRMAVQPLGAGVGSTGSASILGDNGLIIENQYLMIAHEAGWLGLLLYFALFGLLLRQLWQRRKNWLALSVFASGIGLAVVGLMLPVWADDTVSIVWWGLAVIAIIGGTYGNNTTDKKAKRTA